MEREAFVRGLRALWPALMVIAGAGAFGVLTQKLPPAVISILAGVTLAFAATPSARWLTKASYPAL